MAGVPVLSGLACYLVRKTCDLAGLMPSLWYLGQALDNPGAPGSTRKDISERGRELEQVRPSLTRIHYHDCVSISRLLDQLRADALGSSLGIRPWFLMDFGSISRPLFVSFLGTLDNIAK